MNDAEWPIATRNCSRKLRSNYRAKPNTRRAPGTCTWCGIPCATNSRNIWKAAVSAAVCTILCLCICRNVTPNWGTSLPIYPELTEEQVLRVADVIKEFFVEIG